MAVPPDEAVASIIDTAIGSLALGTDLFRGPVREPSAFVPHRAVFALATGGQSPLTHNQGNTGPDIKRATVQVRVRSNVGDFATAQTLAREIWTALQRATFAGYIGFVCRESEPIYLGQDDGEHHEWSINVESMREE